MEVESANPYIKIVNRKCKLLRKKLNKIENALAKSTLTEEEKIMVSFEDQIKNTLSDIEAIKFQLEEVAKEDLKATASAECSVSPSELKPEVEMRVSNEVSTETMRIEQFSESTQCEIATEPLPENTEDPSVFLPIIELKLKKILKALHVCARYEQLKGVGEKLPHDINYFYESILGRTSLGGFTETLDSSLRIVGYYLSDTEECLNEDFTTRVTYNNLADLVDNLATQLDGNYMMGRPASSTFDSQVVSSKVTTDSFTKDVSPELIVSSNGPVVSTPMLETVTFMTDPVQEVLEGRKEKSGRGTKKNRRGGKSNDGDLSEKRTREKGTSQEDLKKSRSY